MVALDLYTSHNSPASPVGLGSTTYGTRVVISKAGQVTHLRLWSGASRTGTTVEASLWDAGGSKIRSVTSTAIAAGWNELALASSLVVTAGQQFTLAVHNNDSVGYLGEGVVGTFHSHTAGAWTLTFPGDGLPFVYKSADFTNAYPSINTGYGELAVGVVVVNLPPNAATLTTMATGGTVARGDVNRAGHSHSDPDGDGQASFRLRHRLVGAATWTTLPDQVTPNQFYDFPAASLALGDHERQVATSDGTEWGPWSASGFFTVIDRPAGPTFVDPINGQTLSSESYTATVSHAGFDTLEWRVLGSLGGAPDPANVINPLTSTTVTSFTMTGLPNGQTVHPQVRAVVGGIAGGWTSLSNPVSFTPPAVPSVTVLASSAEAAISVTVSNPAPSGGEPSVASNDLWRRETAVGGAGIRVAAARSVNGTWVDYTPASGVDYEYAVVANGSNGTTAASAWVGAATSGEITYYGGGYA